MECRSQRSRNGLLLHQRRYLKTWHQGGIELRIGRKSGTAHIQLFDDRWHGYCGQDLYGVLPRDRTKDMPGDICPDCRNVFNQLLERYVLS